MTSLRRLGVLPVRGCPSFIPASQRSRAAVGAATEAERVTGRRQLAGLARATRCDRSAPGRPGRTFGGARFWRAGGGGLAATATLRAGEARSRRRSGGANAPAAVRSTYRSPVSAPEKWCGSAPLGRSVEEGLALREVVFLERLVAQLVLAVVHE